MAQGPPEGSDAVSPVPVSSPGDLLQQETTSEHNILHSSANDKDNPIGPKLEPTAQISPAKSDAESFEQVHPNERFTEPVAGSTIAHCVEATFMESKVGLPVMSSMPDATDMPSTQNDAPAGPIASSLGSEWDNKITSPQLPNHCGSNPLDEHGLTSSTEPSIEARPAMDIDRNEEAELQYQQAGAGSDVLPDHDRKQGSDSLFVSQDEEVNRTTSTKAIKRGRDSFSTPSDDPVGLQHNQNKRLKPEPQPELDPVSILKVGNNGKVIPYDPSTEKRPAFPAYHPEFSRTEAFAANIVKTALRAWEKAKTSGVEKDEIERICKALEKYRSVQPSYPPVRHVAFFGPAGIGKSTTINSTLNQRAAAESDSADRGTNLVHEYVAPSSKQLSRYVVSAKYLAGRQLASFVEQHCARVYDFLDQEESGGDGDDVEELRQALDTSLSIFNVLLCDKEDFVTVEKVQEYFEDHMQDREEAHNQLKYMINELKASRALKDEVEDHEANNSRELSEKFRLVSRVPQAGSGRIKKPHPWPIIRKVEVHIDNDLLNAGVLLGDTPGTSDTNQAVVDSTTNYIRNAGLVLITEGVKRINNSTTLDANLLQLVQMGKTSEHACNICLVVTSIDTLANISEDWRHELLHEDKAVLEEVEGRLVRLLEKKTHLDEEMRSGRIVDARKMIEDLRVLPIKIAAAEAKVAQSVVEIKTRDIEEKLRGRLRQVSRSRHDRDLEVIFVSNTEYQKHVQGYDPAKPPILDIEATGIPKLRRKLYEEPASGKGQTLKRICEARIPTLLMSITGVLTKSKLERKQEVVIAIEAILNTYHIATDHLFDDLRRSFKSRVLDVFEDPAMRLQAKATKLADDFMELKAQTFLAFCRKGGQHKVARTKTVTDWNSKIQMLFAEQFAAGYDDFVDETIRAESNLLSNTRDLFDKLTAELDVNQDFQGVDGQREFIQMVRNIRDVALKTMSTTLQYMQVDFAEIRNRCILKPDNTSYVSEGMAQAYHKCAILTVVEPDNAKKRKGARSKPHITRAEIIREKLTGNGMEPSIFADVAQKAKQAFEETAAKWVQQKYAKALKDAATCVLEEFDARFAVDEEQIKPDRPELLEQLKLDVAHCLDMVNGELKESVKQWDTFENRDR